MKVQTLIAVAHPWHCDVMGHMNTRHIMALFDDACFALLDQLGADFTDRAYGWADVKLEVNLHREIPAGTVLRVASTIERIGRSSFVHVHELNSRSGSTPHATVTVTTVRFDLKERKSASLTDEFRRSVADLMDGDGTERG